jgi:hypothetical protein
MDYARGAEFCFTGFTVVWPVMAWSGNLEAGVAVCALLLYGASLCGLMTENKSDR